MKEDFYIIKVNGYLYGIANQDGRFRKNWRNEYRKRDRILLKFPYKGYCKKCKLYNKLTIHHDPPLSISLNGKKILLCVKCHVEEEFKCSIKYKLKDRPQIIHCQHCKCNRNNYFDEKRMVIYCKKCRNEIQLKKIGENNYKIIKNSS